MENNTVEPVFFKHSDYQSTKELTVLDVYTAIKRIINPVNLSGAGAQNVRGIWRIYTLTRASRLELLLSKELIINNQRLTLYDANPAVTGADATTERVQIKDIPLSVSNVEIQTYLLSKGVELTSPVRNSKLRDENGQLINFLTGDRFVYAKAPIQPVLQRNVEIGGFRARVYHDGQFRNCKACGQAGHKPGTTACDAYLPDGNILPFRSDEQPMSNFYPCSLEYEGRTFNSTEQALQYTKAIDTKHPQIAKAILKAENAREAWKASRALPEDEALQWDKDNIHQVEQMLGAKATQVPAFSSALLESKDAILAEATGHKFWATGIPNPEFTKTTKEQYWPGQNKLGELLMNLREYLQDKEEEKQNKASSNPPDTQASSIVIQPSQEDCDSDTDQSSDTQDELESPSEEVKKARKQREKKIRKKNKKETRLREDSITRYMIRKRNPTSTPPAANAKKKPLLDNQAGET
jgi:ribA/ribD-fused uncharacterized protein